MAKKTKIEVFSKKKDVVNERQQRLKQSQEAILNKKTPFVIQEAYRTARTNIMFSMADEAEKSKVICVTSPNAGEGKTTSTLNLAITFAQTGSKVLLIDCDLRKPRIHQYLGVVKTDGLTTILSKQKEFEDVVYHNLRPGLDCLTSGSIPPNPAELLASESMHLLIEKLRDIYDYILLDTPPITVVTDAVALSRWISGIMLVVREGYTNHESIEQALNLLNIAGAKVIGFFVNDIDAMSMNYGAYRSSYGRGYSYMRNYKYRNGGYGYGYGYGYSYSDRSSRKKNESKKSNNKNRQATQQTTAQPADMQQAQTDAEINTQPNKSEEGES